MSWLSFEAGMAVGSWLTAAGTGLFVWIRRRRDRRLNVARAQAMAAAISRFFNEPTPGCNCPSCTAKRTATSVGAN